MTTPLEKVTYGSWHRGLECKGCGRRAGVAVWAQRGLNEEAICPMCGDTNGFKRLVVRYGYRYLKGFFGWKEVEKFLEVKSNKTARRYPPERT